MPRVYLDVEPWHIRPHTTDWRYVRYQLPRLVEWDPGLALYLQQSLPVAVGAGASLAAATLRRRLFGAWMVPPLSYAGTLDAGELKRSGCNVVFSHRGFPINAGETPVVWQNSVLDPEMRMFHTGCSRSALEPEMEAKGPLFRRAAVVQVSTLAECQRLGVMFPDIAERFQRVSFFLPDARACAPEELDRHISPPAVRVLFVGREARRKGLDLLLDARQRLPLLLRKRMRLKIVSSFADGKIPIPNDGSIEVSGRLDHASLMAEMRRAHILVNPARFESFGLVFPEAMSQGAAIIGPDWEVQRELLDNGRAGILVSPEVAKLTDKLAWLIEDDQGRRALAIRGRERFITHYAPDVVARQFSEVFIAAAGDSNRSGQPG